MKWINQDDPPTNKHFRGKGFEIFPLDIQKRLRVLGGWLVDALFDGMNCFNHINRIRAYFKQGTKLKQKYPIYEKYLDEININVWALYQQIYKEEIKPQIKMLKVEQINKDLKRMGFI